MDALTPTLQELEEQQRHISDLLQQRRQEELADLKERAARLNFALVPIGQVQKKRGRKPKQQQDQF